MIREGGVSDPAEGDNATLICQANLFSLPPEWAYMNTYTRKLYDLDDYSPPTGNSFIITRLTQKYINTLTFK